MSYHTEGPSFEDPAGEPHIPIAEDCEAAEPCPHERRSINFFTAALECDDCREMLMDLNGFVEPSLRVKR